MSGKIVNNVFRASGVIAATPGGLDWSTAVVTGSTLSASAGKGYFINTTSNACTVTLPSSAEIGDQIVFADYARTWSTNNLIIDSNGNNFQGDPDTYTVDYSTAGQSLNIVYSDATKGWLPVSDDAVAFDHTAPPLQRAIFAYGTDSSSKVTMSNLVNSSGVVGSDVTGVGSVKTGGGGASYGGDKGIFGFGEGASDWNATTNLVNTSGVIASDTSAVSGASGRYTTACSFGADRAMFIYGYGWDGSANIDFPKANLVSNVGVVAADTTAAGTARRYPAATRYGGSDGGKAIVYGGAPSASSTNLSNLISSSGVIASDTTGVGTARHGLAGSPYGGDKAVFALGFVSGGSYTAVSNKISNSGVVASDTSASGTARDGSYGAPYGGDKGIFAYGTNGSGRLSMSNLVSNSGAVATDTTGVGTPRHQPMASGYSTSA